MTLEELKHFKFEEKKLKDYVIISFGPFNCLDDIHAVDKRLYEEIPESIGEHDGHEVCMDDTDGRFYTYGNNAEELFKVMKPILLDFDFLEEAYVYLSFTENNKEIRNLEFKLKQA